MEGLSKPATFETAQVQLGNLVGFVAGKVEEEGSPDPWWICGTRCVVFEDYVNTGQDGELDVTKTRQAASHPNWMQANVPQTKGCSFTPVVVTPARNIRTAAVPHAQCLRFWSYAEFMQWAERALQTVRELRATFFEQGDLVWQAEAATLLKQRGLDFATVMRFLEEHPLADCLTHT